MINVFDMFVTKSQDRETIRDNFLSSTRVLQLIFNTIFLTKKYIKAYIELMEDKKEVDTDPFFVMILQKHVDKMKKYMGLANE